MTKVSFQNLISIELLRIGCSFLCFNKFNWLRMCCFQEMYKRAAEFWAELRVELLSASTFLASEKPSASQLWRLYWASHQVPTFPFYTEKVGV